MRAISDFRAVVHHMAAMLATFAVLTAYPAGSAVSAEGGIRPAVWAGSFYPADPLQLAELIDRLTATAAARPVELPPGRPLCALIMPHAGYAYSGLTAAHAARLLRGRQYRTLIVMAPDHRVGFRNNAISAVSAYETPMGRIPLSAAADGLRAKHDLFGASKSSDATEHSVEVVLPFLQSQLDRFEFIPIVMGPGSPPDNAAALEPLIAPETLLVVSSDLSHFLTYEQAVHRDEETIRAILSMDSAYLTSHDNIACGLTPILTLLEIARAHRWQPVLLHYANSGDATGDRGRVVGYCAIAFLGDSNVEDERNAEDRLSEAQGRLLTALARHTIARELGLRHHQEDDRELQEALVNDDLKRHCGTFVTLKIDNRLRGCIGNLDSRDSIVEAVRRNAVNAAFHDPRFSPLTPDELERTDIEVSVLTDPRPLVYADAEDLISKLRVNIDGLIIRKGGASATFLPQVWEQLPRPEDFLTHLCMKAGLSANAWRHGDLSVQTYQVQYFEERR